MYIDYHKYNYELLNENERLKYIERDKSVYKNILSKWITDNLDNITNRKWEIEEIGHLTEVSDFIKLLKEAESLFELGFYTSCIALIGVSAEDFSKYLALKLGKTEHIQISNSKGKLNDVSQSTRLRLQLNEEILTQPQYDLLDEIRKKRNDCLHYNLAFKLKEETVLKSDAIICLNNIKKVIKEILELKNNYDKTELLEVITEIGKTTVTDLKNKDEMRWKVRNAMSHLFEFNVAFDPDEKSVTKEDYFLIQEIDLDYNETTLNPIFTTPGLSVIVELHDEEKKLFSEMGLKENDIIQAIIYSKISDIGLTEEWYFVDIRKEENFSEVFEDIISKLI
jgi:hypothetical protein